MDHENLLPAEVQQWRARVMDCALRVHRSLGAGFRESVYQACLAHAFRQDGIPFVEQAWMSVTFEGLCIEHAGRADFIVADCLLVEVKATMAHHPTHAAQVIHYLKATGLPLGLLLNFHAALLKHGYGEYVHPDLLARIRETRPAPRDDPPI